jgi:hypothetical protein
MFNYTPGLGIINKFNNYEMGQKNQTKKEIGKIVATMGEFSIEVCDIG